MYFMQLVLSVREALRRKRRRVFLSRKYSISKELEREGEKKKKGAESRDREKEKEGQEKHRQVRAESIQNHEI